VAWSTPLAHFKAANDDTQWRNWGTRAVQGLTLDLLEQWS
jgi:hypothetical protein